MLRFQYIAVVSVAIYCSQSIANAEIKMLPPAFQDSEVLGSNFVNGELVALIARREARATTVELFRYDAKRWHPVQENAKLPITRDVELLSVSIPSNTRCIAAFLMHDGLNAKIVADTDNPELRVFELKDSEWREILTPLTFRPTAMELSSNLNDVYLFCIAETSNRTTIARFMLSEGTIAFLPLGLWRGSNLGKLKVTSHGQYAAITGNSGDANTIHVFASHSHIQCTTAIKSQNSMCALDGKGRVAVIGWDDRQANVAFGRVHADDLEMNEPVSLSTDIHDFLITDVAYSTNKRDGLVLLLRKKETQSVVSIARVDSVGHTEWLGSLQWDFRIQSKFMTEIGNGNFWLSQPWTLLRPTSAGLVPSVLQSTHEQSLEREVKVDPAKPEAEK